MARALKSPKAFATIMNACGAVALVDLDPADHGEVADFRAGGEGTRYPGYQRALLGVGRAAEHAETAIDARRRQVARRRHGGERRFGPLHTKRFAALRERDRRGIELVRAIRITRPFRTPRIGDRPRNLQGLFDFRVVAPHLAPIDR